MFCRSNTWILNAKTLYTGISIYTNINVSVWSSIGEPYRKEDDSKKDAWQNPKLKYQHEENNDMKLLEAGEMQYCDLLWPLMFWFAPHSTWVCLEVLVANTGGRIWSFSSEMPKDAGISACSLEQAVLWSSAGGWMSLQKQWGLRDEIPNWAHEKAKVWSFLLSF